MLEFRIDSRMKVKTLKANFKSTFGATLRVYTTAYCKTFVDDEVVLGTPITGSTKVSEIVVGENTQVGNFEKKITEAYGIGVQVANPSNTELCENDITLAAAGKK